MENKMTETEMQTKFINENMHILHQYLLWKETILEPQILDDSVVVPAEEVESIDVTQNGTSGMSITKKVIENYGKMD